MLLLIALEDRRLRIEVGRGLEGDLTDIESGRIIREQITPRLVDGDVGAAVEAGQSHPLFSVIRRPLRSRIRHRPKTMATVSPERPGSFRSFCSVCSEGSDAERVADAAGGWRRSSGVADRVAPVALDGVATEEAVAGAVGVAATLGEEVRAVAGELPALSRRRRKKVDQAVQAAERLTGLQFCIYLGPGESDPRQHAESLFVNAGLHERPAVLILVEADRRNVEIVTAPL